MGEGGFIWNSASGVSTYIHKLRVHAKIGNIVPGMFDRRELAPSARTKEGPKRLDFYLEHEISGIDMFVFASKGDQARSIAKKLNCILLFVSETLNTLNVTRYRRF